MSPGRDAHNNRKKKEKHWLATLNKFLESFNPFQVKKQIEAKRLDENKIPAKKGGRIAKNVRLELEQKTGKRVVSCENLDLIVFIIALLGINGVLPPTINGLSLTMGRILDFLTKK